MEQPLPGEQTAIEMRYLGAPVTEMEALGVARRLARRAGRPVPDALPAPDAPVELAAYRIPPLVLAHVRARAEAEGVTATDVVRAALSTYGFGRMGTATTFQPEPHA